MNRRLHDNIIAEYKHASSSGVGGAGWENGVRCVLPEVSVPADSTSTYRLVGKNLFCPDKYKGKSETINGVTFTGNADGSITVNGTATANTVFYLNGHWYNGTKHTITGAYLNRPFVISGHPTGASFSTYNLFFRFYDDATGGEKYASTVTAKGVLNTTGKFNTAYIDVKAGVTCDNLVFKPQIEYGSEATEFTPFYEGGLFTADTLADTRLKQPEGIGNIIEYPDGFSVGGYTGNKGTQIDVKYVTHS
ncbi:MAG: hypothetical protein IJ391_02740 [Clostridia bacterium]|nr:hypothetical protein [Clostridia bacterium]